ncbi:hypothetical protein BaGK_19195 [Bacillus atrophaeus]|nr:hypothetical protein BaGK_19195 [Bacillus atrophaeus]
MQTGHHLPFAEPDSYDKMALKALRRVFAAPDSFLGSSTKIIFGLPISALAITSCGYCPPLKSPPFRSIISFKTENIEKCLPLPVPSGLFLTEVLLLIRGCTERLKRGIYAIPAFALFSVFNVEQTFD